MKIPVSKVEKFCVPAKEEQAQPMMKCVYLDVEGERFLATDGHLAVRETALIDSADVSGLIPVEAFELARKELKAISKATKGEIPDPWLRVLCNEDAVSIENLLTNTIHLVARPKLLGDQKFPNVDAVFPNLTKKATITLNGEYLTQILNSLDGMTVSFWVDSDEKCVAMAAGSGKSVAVLMPMRGDVDVAEINRRGRALPSAGRDPQPNSTEAPTA